MMRKNRFLHISDLHLKEGDSKNYDIKCGILEYIKSVIKEQEIGAILISGDLAFGSTENLLPYLKDWLDHGSKIFVVFGDHDFGGYVRDEIREKFISSTSDLPGLYIFETTRFIEDETARIIEDESLGFCVSGMSCESKQRGFKKSFNNLSNYTGQKPGIFLTHPCELPKEKARQLGYTYYAVGHEHTQSIDKIDENIYKGRPGHLYSVWDGDGKAWPVGYIIGEFINTDLKLSWEKFPTIQTVRLYIDPFKQKDNKALLAIENCPSDKNKELNEILEGKWQWQDKEHRGVFMGYYDLASDGFDQLIKNILNIFIDDIFVTPSDSVKMKKKYGSSRDAFYARMLLSDDDLFKEFMDRIIKATEKTQ